MKKLMMLGMAAMAMTVTAAPIQANAAEQGNRLQLNNGVQNENCILSSNLNCGNLQIGNGTLNELLQGCGNSNGNCGILNDLLQGNGNTGTPGRPDNNGNGGLPEDNGSTEDSEENTQDNTDRTYAEQVVNLVNAERTKEGLSPLTLDTKVTRAANVRAAEIQSSFSHTRPDGSSFSTVLSENGVSYRGSGENIAYGQRSPEEVVNGWMNSPGHRANIMNGNFKNIGVGHARNSNGTQYWVQLFTY